MSEQEIFELFKEAFFGIPRPDNDSLAAEGRTVDQSEAAANGGPPVEAMQSGLGAPATPQDVPHAAVDFTVPAELGGLQAGEEVGFDKSPDTADAAGSWDISAILELDSFLRKAFGDWDIA